MVPEAKIFMWVGIMVVLACWVIYEEIIRPWLFWRSIRGLEEAVKAAIKASFPPTERRNHD